MTACVVDTSEAGEGCIEVEVTGPAGRAIPHSVTNMGPSILTVTFLPTECGQHQACVTFNKQTIPGNILLVLLVYFLTSIIRNSLTEGTLLVHTRKPSSH